LFDHFLLFSLEGTCSCSSLSVFVGSSAYFLRAQVSQHNTRNQRPVRLPPAILILANLLTPTFSKQPASNFSEKSLSLQQTRHLSLWTGIAYCLRLYGRRGPVNTRQPRRSLAQRCVSLPESCVFL